MAEEIIVRFTDCATKKHSVRYNCKDESPAVSSIYISKPALKEIGNPDKVEITIRPLSTK